MTTTNSSDIYQPTATWYTSPIPSDTKRNHPSTEPQNLPGRRTEVTEPERAYSTDHLALPIAVALLVMGAVIFGWLFM